MFNQLFFETFPQVLLGARYSTPADMWSFACLVFELATGDLLFDPRSGAEYGRDDDHLALMAELVGRPPRRVWSAGKRSREFFSRTGDLRRIRRLKFWPLDAVLHEKYGMERDEVSFFLNEKGDKKNRVLCDDDQTDSNACYTVDAAQHQNEGISLPSTLPG